MAREVVALLSAVAMERALEIGVVVDEGVPAQVSGDPTRLRQVMINLVGNAIKFTDAGSVELRVGYDPAEEMLRVAVRDTGIGIPEAARRTLFQRFAQADGTDVRQRGGTGLGLAISKQLVELMGGEIGVESVEGLGSTFSFRIPALPSVAPAEEAASPAPAEARVVVAIDDAPRNTSARILVAEDNPTNQKVLLAYLEMAGHDTCLVTNGAEAVEAAEAEVYDLVLLDIQMPVMDGLDAARAIRALDGPTARVPILALTASAAEGDRERFLAAGITDYLTKPVTMQALFAAIARASETYSSSSVTGAQPSPGSNVSMRAATASVSSPRSAS
jgi:CheY-like chemotaxis protein